MRFVNVKGFSRFFGIVLGNRTFFLRFAANPRGYAVGILGRVWSWWGR